MEHKLITGGEIYLPFARSRIKAMRATGLAYASQQYEIGGTSIAVRIEPGYEYIRIIGGSCTLKMDSGVAYLLSITPVIGSDAYTPAPLDWTDLVKKYNGGFTRPIYRDSELWLENPGKGSAWQVSGVLQAGSEIKGAVRPDKSVSGAFDAGEEEDASVTPPVWRKKKFDLHLFSKKLTVEYCPASVFTGRCRLYVQAMYGQYLYPEGVREEPNSRLPNLYGMPLTEDAPPSLLVASHIRSGETPRFPQVLITSSSGVYLDKETGKHWLINIEGGEEGQLSFYPLVAGPCAEKMRRRLTTKGSKGLSSEDRDHLEAYILSDSRPDTAGWQKISLRKPPTWSLGYGWHWNYSGTCADMVSNALYPQDNEPLPNTGLSSGVGKYQGVESTHSRITVGLSLGVWTASIETVSGPNKWSAPAGVVILTEVDWSTRKLIKIMPRFTIPHNSSATVYAFYNGDILKTCKVDVRVIAPKPARTEFSDPTYNTGYANTLGLREGWLNSYQPEGETYEGSVSCDGTTCAFSGFGRSSYETRVTNKSYTGFDSSPTPIGSGAGIYGDWYSNTGYPPYTSVEFKYPAPSEGVSFGADAVEFAGDVYYDYTTNLSYESQGAYCILIPPMNDAEAVYLVAKTHNILYRTGAVRTHYHAAPGSFMSAVEYRSRTSPGGDYRSGALVKYSWGGNGESTSLSSGPIDDETIERVVSESNTLIYNGGSVALKEGYEPSYLLLTFDEDDFDNYDTRTSASGKAMTTDPHKVDTVGFTIEATSEPTSKLPAFLGWA